MRPMKDAVLDELEDVALLGCKSIRAFLVYQGDNPSYQQKAKIGAMAVTNYTRARATEANRQAIDLMMERQGKNLLPAQE